MFHYVHFTCSLLHVRLPIFDPNWHKFSYLLMFYDYNSLHSRQRSASYFLLLFFFFNFTAIKLTNKIPLKKNYVCCTVFRGIK